MKVRLPSLLFLAVAAAFSAHAATPKDTLVIASTLEGIISLDPAESFEIMSSGNLINIYQQIVSPDRQHPDTLDPDVASSWTKGDSDHSLVFTIKPGAKFASGNPVTADDVIYSYTRAVKLNKSPSFILGELGWTPDNIDTQFKKVGDDKLQISWPADIGSELVLRVLTAPVAAIVDSKLVKSHAENNDFGNSWLRSRSAGSGAFEVRNYVPHEALVLKRNPNAHPLAKLENVLFKNVADPATRRLLVLNGDADIAYDLGADQFASLQKEKGVRVSEFPATKVFYLAFNTGDTTQPALNNPALWQAARWLVDYKGISQDLLKGQYTIHQTFLPDGLAGAIDDQPFKLDVAKAKEILSKAGIAEGTKIDLLVINQPPYSDIAQSLQASFAKAGINLVVHPLVESDVLTRMRAHKFQSIFTYWGADYLDPNTNASTFAYNVPDGPKTLAQRIQWVIPEISKQTREAAAESDPAKRLARYADLQRELQRNSPFVVALQSKLLVALRDNVTGASQNVAGSQLYLDTVNK
jgi:peptide/nickel transport system substrate-binding protein